MFFEIYFIEILLSVNTQGLKVTYQVLRMEDKLIYMFWDLVQGG